MKLRWLATSKLSVYGFYSQAAYRWGFFYLHGKAEHDPKPLGFDPDMCLMSMPIGIANFSIPFSNLKYDEAICIPATYYRDYDTIMAPEPIVIVAARAQRTLPGINGRIALLDDSRGLRHALNPSEWR